MVLLGVFSTVCYGGTRTASHTLSGTFQPNGKLSVPANLSLTTSGSTFVSYLGSMTMQYRARTTSAGSGTITVNATADFTPVGGPTISTGKLTFTCASASLGTACAGTQTMKVVINTTILTIGSGACTGPSCFNADPNSMQINFILENDPQYSTGTYSASVLFTISTVVSWRVTGGSNAQTWTLSVRGQAGGSFTNCSTVPNSAVRVNAPSGTNTGGGATYVAGGQITLTSANQQIASGIEGTGTRNYTANVTYTIVDAWRFRPSTAVSCTLSVTYTVNAP
ncbi:MAG: hypothetical protein EXQ52_15790 [Bryobacterales bacterium]|nr:hypothetical protein [Bryobacterales bacterium]